MQYSLQEAKTQLSKLLDRVEAGGEVIIVRHGKPAARLERIVIETSRHLGRLRGSAPVPDDDTFQAMTAEETDAFWEGR